MAEDRLQSGKEGWTRIFKPRISSQVAPSFAVLPIKWGKEVVSLIEPLPRVVLDIQVWLCRQGTKVKEVTTTEVIMLSPWGERMTTALWGNGNRLTPGGHRMKLEGTCIARPTPLTTWREFTTDACDSRRFLTRRLSPLI